MKTPLLAMLILSSAVGRAQSATPACFELFAKSDPSSFASLYQLDDEKYTDDYRQDAHVENFWKFHKRFGIVRTAKNELLLIAKDDGTAKTLIADLARFTGLSSAAVRGVPTPEGVDGVAYYVTALLPKLAQDRLEINGMFDGPNCMNACLVQSGYAMHAVYTTGEVFANWVNSPFVQAIADARGMQPGDVLVVKAQYANGNLVLLHGAVYISPRLVLTKNGYQSDKPLRVADINEMASQYLIAKQNPAAVGANFTLSLEGFRFLKVDEVLAEAGLGLPVELAQAQEQVAAMEELMASVHDGDGRFPKDATLLAFQKNWQAVVSQGISRLDRSLTLNPYQQQLLRTLWQDIGLRLEALRDGLQRAHETLHR